MIIFNNVMILGLGLIGGSLALALKKAGYTGKIIGFDIAKNNLDAAVHAKAIDIAAQTLQEALAYDGLIIIAVPLGEYQNVLEQIACLVEDKEVVITDVGSVKSQIHDLADKALSAGIPFVGGHPMAGSEKGGFSAATPYLFQNAYYFLTSAGRQEEKNMLALKKLVESIGAFPVIVTPLEHDAIVAKISHVPHLMASVLANTLDIHQSIGYAAFAGGGFRDTTRIAAGNPSLWKDILCFNKKEILEALQPLHAMLFELEKMLSEKDELRLTEFLQRAKFIRDGLPKYGKDYLPAIYPIIVDVEDRPGIIADLTRIIGEHNLNIREIEIMHARENTAGAIRIGFATEKERLLASQLLTAHQFVLTLV